jgi:hypothetical protein
MKRKRMQRLKGMEYDQKNSPLNRGVIVFLNATAGQASSSSAERPSAAPDAPNQGWITHSM